MKNLDENIILRYLQKKSTSEDYMVLNEWIKTSEENKRALFALEEMCDRSKWKHDTEEDADEALKRLKKRLEEGKSESSEKSPVLTIRKSGRFIPFIKYAAAVLIIAMCSLSYFVFIDNDSMKTIYADNSIKKVILEDGTKIWLNKGSYLQYPKDYSDSKRTLRLNGEAYFEVAKQNGNNRFTVESKMMNVTVHGTIFNMKSYDNGQTAEASLIEGEVMVESEGNGSKIVLLPGQKAIVNKKDNKMIVENTNATMDSIWRNDMVPFQNATIKDIAKVLEEIYNVHIELSKDIDLKSTYSGMIKKKDKLEDTMEALKNSIPIDFTIKNDFVTITPTR